MMKTQLLLTCLVACLTILSCNQTGNTPQDTSNAENSDSTSSIFSMPDFLQQEPAIKPIRMLLFVDLSKSMQQSEVDKIAEKVAPLVNMLPPGSKLKVKLIDDVQFQESLMDLTVQGSAESTRQRQKQANKVNKLMCDSLINMIYADHEKNQQRNGAGSYRKSCIINTFETAFDYFKQHRADTATMRFSLVYLSDMIEQCKASKSVLGETLYMMDNTAPTSAEVAALIDQNYTPNFNLKELLGQRMYCIATINEQFYKDPGCMPHNAIKEAWQVVLQKLGYSKQEAAMIYFSPDLPEKFD